VERISNAYKLNKKIINDVKQQENGNDRSQIIKANQSWNL
jgi:hypothetical protein